MHFDVKMIIIEVVCDLLQLYNNVIMERDHLGFFIDTEFLAWADSPFCIEYSCESFKRKINIDHKLSYGLVSISRKHPLNYHTHNIIIILITAS